MIKNPSYRRGSNSWHLAHGLLDTLQPWRTLSELHETGPDLPSDAATIVRLFRSKHVSDLKFFTGLIVWFVILGMIVVVYSNGVHHGEDFFNKVYAPLGTILGLGGVAIGWVYRTASSRLGIVDLFAYEITTICRVGTIVDAAQSYTDRFQQATDAANGNTNGPVPSLSTAESRTECSKRVSLLT